MFQPFIATHGRQCALDASVMKLSFATCHGSDASIRRWALEGWWQN